MAAPEDLSALRQPLGGLIDAVVNDWRPLLDAWRCSSDGQRLTRWVDDQVSQGEIVYPADVFCALRLTALADTRILILGQDPYHGPGQAEGLAFSVPAAQPLPPSLRNILKELRRSHPHLTPPASGHLGLWARSGILLLNTVLTVARGRPASHAGRGWESLTNAVVQALARDVRPKVFMLWGAHAQSKSVLIEGLGPHLILRCNHPSPLSAMRGPQPFIGCGHFSAACLHLTTPEHVWDWPS